MSRDSQRYRKTYSYYRVQPRTELLEVIVDESLDWKKSVRAASTTTHSLTGAGSSISIGGVTIVDEDRVLLKDQSPASQNGIYYFEATDGNYSLTRSSDSKSGTLSCGAATYVEEGTNAGKIYILTTTNPIDVDSTSLTWTEFGGGGGSTSPGGSNTYVQFNDGGSFGGDSDLRFNKTTGALTGTYIVASTGFSGSLTKLTDGTSYLRAGTNITISTGSNGAVTIDAAGSSGPTGSGTDGYLARWSGSSTALGDSFIRDLTPSGSPTIAKYYKNYHYFDDQTGGGTYVFIKSNNSDGGKIGINVNPSYALDIEAGANSINEAVRIRNNNAGQGTGLRQTFIAGNYSEPTFRITHAWPSNAEGHYTFFGITKPTPSAGTPNIAERLKLYSSGSVEVSGSFVARLDPEIINKPVLSAQKANGTEVMWVSSSAGTNTVGTDVFMWVSGSRTSNNTGADKVVFGGDVRISGSLSVGTGSVLLTSNDVQFGSNGMRIQKSGNDMKFFDLNNLGGLTLSELAAGGGGSSPAYWTSVTSGQVYATGSVGIGTSNPSQKLHVYDNGIARAVIEAGSYAADFASMSLKAAGGEFKLELDNEEARVVLSETVSGKTKLVVWRDAGNLIGYMPGVLETQPNSGLFVTGSVSASDTTLIVRPGYTNGSSLGVLDVQNKAGGTLLYVSGSGNIGIGTNSSLLGKLNIVGGSVLTDQYLWNRISSGLATASRGLLFTIDGTDYGRIYSPNGKSIALQAGSGTLTDAVTLDQSGNVGIGTTSPSTPLHVRTATANLRSLTLENAPDGSPADYDAQELLRLTRNSALNGLTFSAGDARLMTATVSPSNEILWRAGTVGFQASNYVIMRTGGNTEAMRIDSSQRVGIGTATMSNKLAIYDTAADQIYVKGTSTNRAGIKIDNTAGQQSQILFTDGGIDKWQFGKQTDNTFFVYDTTATRNIIQGTYRAAAHSDIALVPYQNGRVGIGTDPSNLGKLEIYATGSLQGIYQSDGTRWLRILAGTSTAGGYNGIVSDNDYALIFSGSKATNTPSLVLAPWDTSGATSGLKIDPSGNVGIGATTISARFHVSTSSDEVSRFQSSGNPYISLYSGAARQGYFYSDGSAVQVVSEDLKPLWLRGASSLALQTNGSASTSIFLIDTSGNVGIGTNNPGQKLHVYNSSSDTRAIIETNAGTYTSLSLKTDNGNKEFKLELDNEEVELVLSEAVSGREKLVISRDNGNTIGRVPGVFEALSNSGLFVTGSVSASDTTLIVRPGYTNGSSLGVLDVQNKAGGTLLYVSGSGNVGIGTSTVSSKLHIFGSNGETATIIRGGTTAPANAKPILQVIGYDNSTVLWVSGSSTHGARVGIGTTNPRASAMLEVGSKGSSGTNNYVNVEASSTGECGYSWTNGGANALWKFSRAASTSNLSLTEQGSSNIALLCEYTTGYVGIGTGDPSEKLHVESGNVKVNTSGYGVILPSTPSNAGSQTLDCYNEFTSTNVVLVTGGDGAVTMQSSTAVVTRTGRMVTVAGDLQIDSDWKGASSGRMWINFNNASPALPLPAINTAVSIWATDLFGSFSSPIIGYLSTDGLLYIDQFDSGIYKDLAPYITSDTNIKFTVTYSSAS